MHRVRPVPALLLLVALGACRREGATDPPGVIEQTATDVETEVDQAGQTVEQVGDDVDHTATDIVERDD